MHLAHRLLYASIRSHLAHRLHLQTHFISSNKFSLMYVRQMRTCMQASVLTWLIVCTKKQLCKMHNWIKTLRINAESLYYDLWIPKSDIFIIRLCSLLVQKSQIFYIWEYSGSWHNAKYSNDGCSGLSPDSQLPTKFEPYINHFCF